MELDSLITGRKQQVIECLSVEISTMSLCSRIFVGSLVLLCVNLNQGVFAQSEGFLPSGEFPKTDFSRRSVPLETIRSGGPPRDGIPPIDHPVFVDTDEARAWLTEGQPVIAVVQGDTARAYPLQIMIFHEIVNDTLDGVPVAVTFCPLCNASLVFERRVGDRILDFGTTGRLRNSDLIMYDRQSESWWQQFTGRGIIGEYTDVSLVQLPSQIVSFETFRDAWPHGRVLSSDTGHQRPYGQNPYRGYDHIDNNPFLYDGPTDPRLPAMERVLSIGRQGDSSSLLLPLSELVDTPLLHLSVDGQAVVVLAMSDALSALDHVQIEKSRLVPSASAFRTQARGVELQFEIDDGVLRDKQTGSRWDSFGRAVEGTYAGERLEQIDRGVHFAFAWLAFEPESEVFSFDDRP